MFSHLAEYTSPFDQRRPQGPELQIDCKTPRPLLNAIVLFCHAPPEPGGIGREERHAPIRSRPLKREEDHTMHQMCLSLSWNSGLCNSLAN